MRDLPGAKAPWQKDIDHQPGRPGRSADDHRPAAGHQAPGSPEHPPLGDPADGHPIIAEQPLHRQDLALRFRDRQHPAGHQI